jgi:hypothetical protein
MTPKLRLRPRAVLPAIYWRLSSDLLGMAGDWVLIDPAAETITVMTDAEVHEAFEVSGEATDPRRTDPAPAPANDTEDRGSTPEPDNGNGEDEGGVEEEAADIEPHGPFPGNARRRRGYTSFAQVTHGGRTLSITSSAVLALSCLSAYGKWATAQQDLCPDQLGKVNGLLTLLWRARLVGRREREPGVRRFLWCASHTGHRPARTHGQAALEWLARREAG